MSVIDDALETAMNVDGAVCAAMVDYESGMCLGTTGDEHMDVELAAAGNTEVVRSKRDIIERLGLDEKISDILITLQGQYHLIKVFEDNENVFSYVVLDKDRANLGLARMQLNSIDTEFDL